MSTDELKRTDAKVRLGLLEEAKRELLVKVKDSEKNMKILLSQVKTMQRLMEEAQSEMMASEKENMVKLQEEIDEQTEVLEEILEDTKTAKKDAKEIFGEEEINSMYKGSNEPQYRLNEDLLTKAASAASTDRLQELKYKTNWTSNDAKEFFSIYDSVKVSQDYKLNEFVQDNINDTNNVLQDVLKQQQKQIQQHYKPQEINSAGVGEKPAYQSSSSQIAYKPNEGLTKSPLKKMSELEKAVEKRR